MQSYLEYNLLRLFDKSVGIVLAIFLFAIITHTSYAYALVDGEVVRDTLYRDWSKNKSTLPYFFYELENFEDPYQRAEIEGLIGAYGIGGVYLRNGNAAAINDWLQKVNDLTDLNPLIIAKIDRVFELPFTFPFEQSNQVQIESLTSQVLMDRLTQNHASILKSMGVGVVHFEHLPRHYSQIEIDKVVNYIVKLKTYGLKLSFGEGCKDYIERIGWVNIDWIPNSLAVVEGYKLKKKGKKHFKKETGYQGFVVGVLDQVSFYSDKENQLDNGYDVLTLPKQFDPHLVINNLILAGSHKSSVVKRSAKEYFEYWNNNKPIHDLDNLLLEISSLSEINTVIDRASITLLMDFQNLIPFRDLSRKRFYSFSNSKSNKSFTDLLDRYVGAKHFDLSYLELPIDTLLRDVEQNSILIVDLSSLYHTANIDSSLTLLSRLKKHYEIVILYQGDRFNLTRFNIDVPMLWTSKMGNESLLLMIQSLFGVYEIQGGLPEYLNVHSTMISFQRKSLGRLAYLDIPTHTYDLQKFNEIDDIIAQAIRDQAFPGCQVMMIRGGNVIYDKSHGYMTYDSLTSLQWGHIYDIASITKTVATVPMLMTTISNGGIELSDHLGDYLSLYKSSDKSNLTFTELLTHQSGLRSYIPFWRHASYAPNGSTFLYKKERRSSDLMKINWSDSIQSWIAHSSYNSLITVDNSYKYLYSDLGFMAMKELIEERNLKSMDLLVDSLLYQPLGMNFTTYNPLNKFDSLQIAPTSLESTFRNKLLRGQVHDKNAALLGGVSGHAGLFSNANDLAKYMQMMLQKGSYGGYRYFDSLLVDQFTSKFDQISMRGLGWDKPRKHVGNVSQYASEEAFGHSGFTGTLVWADPKYDLVYVFLSNRVYPDPENSKLMEQNIRTRIHDLMYESFLLDDNVANQYSSSHF